MGDFSLISSATSTVAIQSTLEMNFALFTGVLKSLLKTLTGQLELYRDLSLFFSLRPALGYRAMGS